MLNVQLASIRETRDTLYIRDELRVDALMISEIEADSPLSTSQRPQSEQLNQVAREMGSNWKYFLDRAGGDLRLGLLFNTDRVQLKKLVNLDAPVFPVSGKDVLDRDPFVVWISDPTNSHIRFEAYCFNEDRVKSRTAWSVCRFQRNSKRCVRGPT